MDRIILFILIVLAFFAWWGMLCYRWQSASTGDRILGAMVLTAAQLCTVGFMLGLVGHWNWITAMVYNATITYFVWICEKGLSDDFKRVYMRLSILYKSPTLTAMTVLGLITVWILSWIALSGPPMSYDFWGYHGSKAYLMDLTGWLPPYRWTGTEYVHGFDGYDDILEHRTWVTDFYPANGSILLAYGVTFGLPVRWLSLVQLPFLSVIILSVYSLCRRIVALDAQTSFVVALATLSVWTIMGQITFALTDLIATALVWAGYSLVMTDRRTGLILSAIACGLAIGTKSASGYWCIGVFLLAIYQTWRTK